MIATVSANIRPDDDGSLAFLGSMIDFLRKRGVATLLPPYDIFSATPFAGCVTDMARFVRDAELVVAIGGDGTFLRTARLFADTGKALFGVNRGRVGFLTEFMPDEALPHLAAAVEGRGEIAERSLLEVEHWRNGAMMERQVFVNDAVISKGAFSRPIDIELAIDGDFLNRFSGDGLIVATTTGSTAYSLSAGGPIVAPPVDSVYVINPICPHVLAVRPMIVSSACTLRARIESRFENLLLTIDGQVAIRIEAGDDVYFRGTDTTIRLVTHPDFSYYDILRQKLGWGR
ncbi:MAG TPA: NAD(+)/NADH kinase [Spirochaetota bacterium]|nr:NAD(+)/NADH kinase [Spirochaetota bacterium]HOS38290.1 NAD(+)/NADH kinase [Spirochaetota bacterium]HPI22773.1 NAD(+)/NADH kinase [Spirochaetota bacterium]HPU87840.1 NAD(+)/NADH kinase [Spirochaetota bacterium]